MRISFQLSRAQTWTNCSGGDFTKVGNIHTEKSTLCVVKILSTVHCTIRLLTFFFSFIKKTKNETGTDLRFDENHFIPDSVFVSFPCFPLYCDWWVTPWLTDWWVLVEAAYYHLSEYDKIIKHRGSTLLNLGHTKIFLKYDRLCHRNMNLMLQELNVNTVLQPDMNILKCRPQNVWIVSNSVSLWTE